MRTNIYDGKCASCGKQNLPVIEIQDSCCEYSFAGWCEDCIKHGLELLESLELDQASMKTVNMRVNMCHGRCAYCGKQNLPAVEIKDSSCGSWPGLCKHCLHLALEILELDPASLLI